MAEKCKECKHCVLLYFTWDRKEIETIRKKQIIKKIKLFCKISKELAIQAPEKLLHYVKEVNPFDVSYEDWNEGFLRDPKTEEEKQKSTLYCVANPVEPDEIEECEECDRFERKEVVNEK